jgi:hypothetical protein
MRSLIDSLPEKLPKIKSNLSLTQAVLKTLSLFPGSSLVYWKVPSRGNSRLGEVSFVLAGDLAGEGVF